ncbi:MAG: glutamate--tRNA ligase [Thermodesulfovibrio sp.]|nr:glutamate--tRNA ligase [Thermodesulfovibrio sp.]
MTEHIRVRFAPSPTGHLHIGGARTALFNWLFAHHHRGRFILRIEDTDTTRSTDEYIEAIIQGMTWLGLDWDEGPFRQTDRFEVYRSYVDRLVKEGKAYYCYCSSEDLEARRQEAMAQGRPVMYDGRCRGLQEPVPGVAPVVRFMMPRDGQTVVHDLIHGAVEFDNAQLDDLIILRSDNTPTYNFTVVVDDVDMRITHVIRGDDHLNNTPKQIQMYKALGYDTPKFAHLPMILGADKTRLSKRHGATSVMAYQEMGYLPDALINYLVRLGWSYGDQEIFTRDELIRHFTFETVGKAASVFNPEKLLWLNSQYIMKASAESLAELVLPFLIKEGILGEEEKVNRDWLASAVKTLQERAKTLIELASSLRYFFIDPAVYDEKAAAKFLNSQSLTYLTELREGLNGLDEYSHDSIEKIFTAIVEKNGIKLGALAQPVRVALTGGTVSPGIFEVIGILGKETTLRRIDRALSVIAPGPA